MLILYLKIILATKQPIEKLNTTIHDECLIIKFLPMHFDGMTMRLAKQSSNFTEASVELFDILNSRVRRQFGELFLGGMTILATHAVDNWLHKSRMVNLTKLNILKI